ncbi:tubulin-like doman-containing protein [Candidatus Poriferisocius sp.]|uniref:tubulin-like doman-containing protein n=1 Tax=Candidatus Poriferisocius sp. TaxID=3101276 RepID=UPI003B02A3FA
MIFIGCGGSGEKAVRYVRDAVRRRLEHAGWEREMPEPWQFIGLDTLTVQESPTEIPTIPGEDFLTLSAEFDSYAALHRALMANHGGDRGRPDLLCGWLPDHKQVRIPLKDGAGQNRAIGRAAGLRSLERVLLPRLKAAFERSKSGAPILHEVGRYLGVDAELGSNTPAPMVVVCSSMAGGTGAGVSLDVVDLVRRCDPQGAHPALVLFANDIFDLPNEEAMAANSLGLMSELLAAYWSEPGEIDSPLAYDGVQDSGVGPHSVFILGKYGYSGASLGSTAEVYQAVGEALSTWVTSSTVQEGIHNFINVNWRDRAKKNHGGYPFGKEHQFGAVSSFGAAKVTVGRDRFSQWAEDKLGREVLEGLLTGHLRLGRDSADRNETEEDLVEKLADRYSETVFKGVDLVGAAGSVAPGCSGAPEHFAPEDRVREIARQVERELESPEDQRASGEQWHAQLRHRGRQQVERIEQEVQAAQDGQWCQEMVDATCKVASQVVAVSSLAVAASALENAVNRLNPAEINQVREDASGAQRKFGEHVERGLSAIKDAHGQVGGQDQALTDAVSLIARGVAYRWQSLRLSKAADVMDKAGREVLRVMADALRAASRQVDIALDDDDVKAWPADGSGVASRYMPSRVELPLEDHATWEQKLTGLCAEAVTDGVPYGPRATDPLRCRLVAGTPLMTGEENIAPLVYRSPLVRWNPGQNANLVCEARREDIEERVRRWTRAPGSKFQREVGEGLASYLLASDPDTGERRVDHADRLKRFSLQMQEAMHQSEPLLSIDQNLYGQIHRDEISLLTVCSQFPFAEGHPAAEDAKKVVGSDAYDTGNQDTTSILVSQYIYSPLNPLAARSFTRPVAEALKDNEGEGERTSSFWLWRRGRCLDAFVPLPRTMVKAIIRGFAAARLCGYVTADAGRPVRITAGPDEAEFPWPLLSRLSTPDDVLAGLLEGFSLTFGMVGSGGLSVYDAYKRLYELGDLAGNGSLPDDLVRVLETGCPPHPTVADEVPKAEGATAEERLVGAQQYLANNIAWFEEQKGKRGRVPAHRGMDGSADEGVPTMELADLYIECYSDLREQLQGGAQRGSVV